MRGALALVLVFTLAGAGAALAGRGDPQKRITPADQARARAMLLRPADLPGWRSTPPSRADEDVYCRALDESDLTVTGEAESRDFQQALAFVSSLSQVYESRADADASWRRGTSSAGVRCLRDSFRNELRKDGDTLVSFGRAAGPPLAQRSARFRMVGQTQGIRIHLEMVVLMHSRAHAAVLVASVGSPFSKAALNRLAAAVAGRMRTAMRGA